MRDMVSKGRHARCAPLGEGHPFAKLTEEQVRNIRRSKKTGVALAREYGMHVATISEIKNRKIWKHVE
jgi:hypothetical protein